MLVIGLTGGIGSGKSTVAEGFSQRGVPVLDTDQVARQVVASGQAALEEIRARFGDQVITASGELDRAAMRALVFADPKARQDLEAITHPRIREYVRDWVNEQAYPYCIVVIPLLLETGWTELVDRILVVDLPESLQLQRTMRRDGMSRQQVESIMAAQVNRQTRVAAADDIVLNDGDSNKLGPQIDALHHDYLQRGGE